MLTQDRRFAGLAQGDGDAGFDTASESDEVTHSHHPRPFHVTGTGPTLVHVEKRGPAFSVVAQDANETDLLPLPVAEQLGRSLVAQDAKAIGDVLNAIDQRNLLGLMVAWSQLLRIHDLHVPISRAYGRPSWEWADMREAVVRALCQCQEPHALLRWMTADALMRGYAMTAASAAESRVDTADEDCERLAQNARAYRAFAEGRA